MGVEEEAGLAKKLFGKQMEQIRCVLSWAAQTQSSMDLGR